MGRCPRINNFGVATESVCVSLLIIMLAVHTTRGPGIVFNTFGTGEGHASGYFGAFMVASLMSGYVLYGFDTAGSLAEETRDPRRHACGYKLANDGHGTWAIQVYLGHKSIKHTVRYTELSPVRFKGFLAEDRSAPDARARR
jgi:hypothetical protein